MRKKFQYIRDLVNEIILTLLALWTLATLVKIIFVAIFL
tara:strand:- start:1374 stop:1490 length:117 start_codon:yes stop_codon:yes gene_type:complete